MKKFLVLLAVLWAAVLPLRRAQAADAIADPAVAAIEAWLNDVHTMKARFTQMAPAGEVTRGTFYLRRPGRLRFEYDPPIRDFIVADGHFVYYWNDSLQQQSNAPIGATIADFLLRDRLDFGGDILVKDVLREPGKVHLSLIQAKEPDQGTLTLVFEEKPLKLLRWEVVDALGQMTQVFLDDIQMGVTLDQGLFYFISPARNPQELNH